MKTVRQIGRKTRAIISGLWRRRIALLAVVLAIGITMIVTGSGLDMLCYSGEKLLIELEGTISQDHVPGTEEFGLSKRELVQKIEAVEALIAKCMREHGFEYIAASYRTVRRGMTADKSLPGLNEKHFIAKYGFGISTLYTGKPPQLAEGYSPAKVGLGEQNIRIYKNLSPADRVAYNHALFGENTEVVFDNHHFAFLDIQADVLQRLEAAKELGH